MDIFEIFAGVPDKEMFEIYKDILSGEEAGLRPRSLDPYAKQLKEICHFEMLSQSTKFAVELFYEEIAKRYFQNYDKSKSETEELKRLMDQDDTLGIISKDNLKVIGHCPEKGYTSWIFKYKNTYVLFHDAGNGHYSFMETLDNIYDLNIDRNYLAYGKYNDLKELDELNNTNTDTENK